MQRIPFVKKEADQYIKERTEKPCFICQIVAGDAIRDRHHILFEDDQVIVFLSSMPTHLGQTLVCPKRHVEDVAGGFSEEEYLHLQTVVHTFTKVLRKALQPERIYIASFGSQQMNRHVHFHLLPLPKDVPVREQQMASMMPELVGYLQLEPNEWKNLVEKLSRIPI